MKPVSRAVVRLGPGRELLLALMNPDTPLPECDIGWTWSHEWWYTWRGSEGRAGASHGANKPGAEGDTNGGIPGGAKCQNTTSVGGSWTNHTTSSTPRGGHSSNTPRSSEPNEAERMGPDILGKLHETNDLLADGHLGSGKRNEREYPKHRSGFLPFHYPRGDGSPSAAKLVNPDRQGVAASAPRMSHGSVTRSSVGKDDAHGVRFLGEVSFQIEQILTLVFENYKSLDESSPSGIKDVFGPATRVAAPALDPALKLYKMLHDILSLEIATRKSGLGNWYAILSYDASVRLCLHSWLRGGSSSLFKKWKFTAEGCIRSKKTIGKIKVQGLFVVLQENCFLLLVLPDGFGDDLIIEVQDSQGKYCGYALVQGKKHRQCVISREPKHEKVGKIQLYTNYSISADENSYKCTSVAVETIAYDNVFGDCDERPTVSAKKLVVATCMIVAESNVVSANDQEWLGLDIMGNLYGAHERGSGPTSKAAFGSGSSDHSRPWSPISRPSSRDDCFPVVLKGNYWEKR
ncbi:hypothetical protein SASPL_123512 [Salvia splendens]|uniref:Uncharacterized protein n=1 Tax=Salvia splendens TaxID=180675 RepID=A0A8X8XQE3_SALSN|nr:hypothetical protein SASPL_123512 [Salvia splendens]